MKRANLILFIVLTFLTGIGQEVSLEWAKSVGGTDDDRGRSMAIDNEGSTYTTGSFQGTVDFDPGIGEFFLSSNGQDDIFVQKQDSDGNFEWAISMGSEGNLDRGESIIVDNDQYVYVTGSFEGTVDFDPGPNGYNLTSNGGSDFFIQKLDSSGNFIWAFNIGGSGYEYSYYITVDNLGGIYTTGSINSFQIDFDPGDGTHNLSMSDGVVFILKLDSFGNFSWAKNMGGSVSPYYFTWGKSICIDDQQNVYATGVFGGTSDFDPGSNSFYLTSNGGNDIFILKLDTSGNFVLAKSIGAEGDDRGNSITMDNTGQLYITGFFRYTTDFDPGPAVFELTSEGESDMFILKLDALGNFSWAKRMGNWDYDNASSISTDADNNIYLTGEFHYTVDFDPNAGVYNLTSFGSYDIFVQKLSSAGDLIWAIQIGGTNYDICNSLCIDNSGLLYLAGYFYGTVDFDPNETNYYQTSNGIADIFITKLEYETIGTNEFKKPIFNLYPNPSKGIIQFTNIENYSALIVYDKLGKKISEQNIKGNQIDLTYLTKGIYFITLTNSDKKERTEKIIIK